MAKRKAKTVAKGGKKKKKGEDEIDLERLLFASESPPSLADRASGSEGKSERGESKLGFIDPLDPDAEVGGRTGDGESLVPAWTDEHDETIKVNIAAVSRLRKLRKTKTEAEVSGVEYSSRLREQFTALNPTNNNWAKITEEDLKNDSGQKLLRSTGSVLGDDGGLREGEIKVTRVKDANMQAPSQGVVRSTRFHPNGQVLMAAGMDKTVRLFQIDGLRNPKLHSVMLKDFPVHCSEFIQNGKEVVMTSRRKHFYVMDVQTGTVTRVPGIKGRTEKSFENFAVQAGPSAQFMAMVGNHGNLMILSQNHKQLLFSVKANSPVASCSFSGNGLYLRSISEDGEVYSFDMRMRRCVSRHADSGAVRGASITCSTDDSFYACGSASGIVNLYDAKKAKAAGLRPTPEKAIMNLTTVADIVRFNSDTQLLAIGSTRAKDALRIVHVPSRTVYANWPGFRTPIQYLSSLDFSPNSGYMAIANARGRVLLYRLNHYTTA